MPELYSRMDNNNWLTPSVAEILDQISNPSNAEGSTREQMLSLQRELNDLETPARIVNVRSLPSYNLFVARPEVVGRIGNRRTITPNEIKKSLAKIAENHSDWSLGFMPKIPDEENGIGILLRTQKHRPLSLRRLMVRAPYRNHSSASALALGISLEQGLVIQDIVDIGNLCLIGLENSKVTLIKSLLLTLLLLNTPSEWRFAFIGKDAEPYRPFTYAPHALGRWLGEFEHGKRLLDGLLKEVQRRRDLLTQANLASLIEYNRLQAENNALELPRVLIVLDALHDSEWLETQEAWLDNLVFLLQEGSRCGIHFIFTLPDTKSFPDFPSYARGSIVSRALGRERTEKLENFHPSLLRFIDGIWLNNTGKEVIPIEFPSVTSDEINKTVDYWQQYAQQRQHEGNTPPVSAKTGVTGLLDTRTMAMPPVPERPTPQTILRAASALGGDLEYLHTSPTTTTPSTPTNPIFVTSSILDDVTLIQRSKALAAYLGWLSVGALHDVMGISTEDAQTLITAFKAQGVLEQSDSPSPRFLLFINT